MAILRKKILSITVSLSIVCLFVPSQAIADDGTMYRKSLGIIGACVVVSGLWNVVKLRPMHGMLRMLSGVAISLGGICSDIIFKRVASLVRQQKAQERPARPGFFGGLQDAAEDAVEEIRDGAHEFYNGVAKPVGNAALSDLQMDSGKQDLKNGKIITGLDKIYDGLYSNIRARCSLALWQ